MKHESTGDAQRQNVRVTIESVKSDIKRHISRGAEYSGAEGVRRLSYPGGRTAIELPCAEDDPDSNVARYALEQIAWREYRAVEGKVVLVTWLTGYDEHGCSRDVHFEHPIRVRVDCNANRDDICRWMDNDHLDPIWDVELVNRDEPVLAGMRSFWLYATSYNLSGEVEKSDVVSVETPMARVARMFGIGKPDAGNQSTRI